MAGDGRVTPSSEDFPELAGGPEASAQQPAPLWRPSADPAAGQIRPLSQLAEPTVSGALTRESSHDPDDYDQLVQAALEGVAPSRRSFKAVLSTKKDRGQVSSKEDVVVVDLEKVHLHKHSSQGHRRLIVDRALNTQDQDNEEFSQRLRARLDRVGLENAKVEVRFRDLEIETQVYVGSRALPTVLNAYRNTAEAALLGLGLMRSHKRRFSILKGVSGVLRPGRLTLLLGPPGSGKSTLLKALAGLLHKSDLQVRGEITFNGETFDSFVPQRTASYIDQVDNHIAELTVRETLDFAARCQGTGQKGDLISQLRQREKEAGIAPDPEIDAFLKASAVGGKRHNIVTDYMLRLLGLEVCSETIVGNQMIRGISGGQRKRVTTGEMAVGPKKTLLMDEISTGLDSSTTFMIVKCIRNYVHTQDATVLMALLQPPPEVFDLFDDVMLLSEGMIIYHGPREQVMPFFEGQGFRLPPRKGIADFLQEVTSLRDQQQYWADRSKAYQFVSVSEFNEAFQASPQGREQAALLAAPKGALAGSSGFDPLVRTRYALSGFQAFKACLRREVTLMRRHAFLYTFRTVQVGLVSLVTATLFFRTTLHQESINNSGINYLGLIFFCLVHMLFNGYSEMSITVGSLKVFYKQRDALFYPAWAFALPTTLLRLPYSFVEGLVISSIVYWVAGFAPDAGRFFIFWLYMFLTHQMAVSLFRLMGALGRSLVVATSLGSIVLLIVILTGGFVLGKSDIHGWDIWVYWLSPLAYAQNAVSVDEMTAARWRKPYIYDPSRTLGAAVLDSRALPHARWWIGVGVAVLVAYTVIFNLLIFACMTFLNSLDAAKPVVPEEALEQRELARLGTRKGDRAAAALPGAAPLPAANGHTNGVEHSIEMPPADGHVAASPAANGAADGATGPDNVDVELGALPGREAPMSERTLAAKGTTTKKGMILPFQPLAMTFHNMCYFVDLPKGAPAPPSLEKVKAGARAQLQLLHEVSGAFRPGVLTALVGVSGAGKTTLMDVLAGRKTGGRITGDIRVDGFPKEQRTFARICGYVEQFDIHSPQTTVREALAFSARLRLTGVPADKLQAFVEEVMDLVELRPLAGALVGLPGQSGLSVEQRKRLTIAVELVANPSIVFMDEPTSGLDARAAAIVMRTVRNTVNTGRTVVCTIHQPSIDIFEAFDDLLLLKRGGRLIYAGALGHHSQRLVDYFQAIPKVPALREGLNPATWMLEVSTLTMEERLDLDFADCWRASELFKQNEAMVEQLSQPRPDAKPLHFASQYSRNRFSQFLVLLGKFNAIYWRSPQYNAVRYVFTVAVALIVGSVYYNLGMRRSSLNDVLNIMGALFASVTFLGTSNSSQVQPVVGIERSVYYRERAAGMYAALPYAAAQAVIELPYLLAQALLYSVIVYFLIYFEQSAAKFFWFLLFTFLTLTYFTMYGMAAVAVSPHVQLAAVISSGFYSFWFLFAGFVITKPSMGWWWKWYWYLDPVAWTLYGLVGSQLGDVTNEYVTTESGQRISVANFVQDYFGFHHDFIGYVVLILAGFAVGFWLLTAFALKKFIFQKR